MKIQLINYSGKNTKGLLVDLCNSFGNAESLDSYDLNIIDLTDELIWQNRSLRADFDTLNCDDDFQTLKTSIIRSSKTNYLYVLPKNIKFKTNFDNPNRHSSKIHLTSVDIKNNIYKLTTNLQKIIPFTFTLYYEKTLTYLSEIELSADFYFDPNMRTNEEGIVISKNEIYSNGSEKLVFLTLGRNSITTLQIENDNLKLILDNIFLTQSLENIPKWFSKLEFFDDAYQSGIAKIEERKIQESKLKIENVERIIKKNKYYESILYKSGKELELVLIEMLVEMLEIKTDFKDTKDEDFSFEKNGIHYLFEFKGLTKDLKKSNISQLMTHVYKYAEKKEISDKIIKRIIIVNRFKDIDPKDRELINDSIIDIAKNKIFNVLIIDTMQFLKLFEKYKLGEIVIDEIITSFDQIGLFELS